MGPLVYKFYQNASEPSKNTRTSQEQQVLSRLRYRARSSSVVALPEMEAKKVPGTNPAQLRDWFAAVFPDLGVVPKGGFKVSHDRTRVKDRNGRRFIFRPLAQVASLTGSLSLSLLFAGGIYVSLLQMAGRETVWDSGSYRRGTVHPVTAAGGPQRTQVLWALALGIRACRAPVWFLAVAAVPEWACGVRCVWRTSALMRSVSVTMFKPPSSPSRRRCCCSTPTPNLTILLAACIPAVPQHTV